MHTDGEAVIMLAFQASGRGSTPLQCNLCIIFFHVMLLFLFPFECIINCVFKKLKSSRRANGIELDW